MGRHAYLLMVHEYTYQLDLLVNLLDDERNDLYIHVDKKAKDFPIEKIEQAVKKSSCFFTKRQNITWGTNSIMNCEIQMIKDATQGGYQYLHLISGADLTIKTQNDIHDWFEKHNGKEFLHFGTETYQRDIQSRYNVYHFFMKKLGRDRNKEIWNLAETYSLAIQRRLKVDRSKKKHLNYCGGANWFSITGELARYIAEHAKEYEYIWHFTQNSDEMWLQTLVMNSPYKDNLYIPGFRNDYSACMRYIDWNRGTPYVFRIDDFDMLMNSECMFARKFDEKVDKDIIEKIYHTLKEKSR